MSEGEGEGGVGIRLPICGGGVTTGLPHMSTFCSCTRVYGNDCGAMMRVCVGECFVSFFLFCFI